MGNHHRGIWGVLLLLILLISLCGCSQSAKSEREIIEDLQQSPIFISNTVKIDDYTVIKRQTDKNNKSDVVYITVRVSEDELKCTLSYIMQYILYNDGWILESVNRYFDGPWSVGGLTIGHVLEDIQKSDPFFIQYGNLDITEHEVDCLYPADDYYRQYAMISITAENDQIVYQPQYSMYYGIEGNRWSNETISIESDYFEPVTGPDAEYIKELGESIDCLKEYDRYKHFITMTDLENCKAVEVYSADRIYEFGIETDHIFVPLSFYRAPDEELPAWHCIEKRIEIELNYIDWNIEGVWTGKGFCRDEGLDDSWGEWDVWLSISEINYIGSGKSSAKVSCNATYTIYDSVVAKKPALWKIQDQDTVTVEIQRVGAGEYEFCIPDQAWGGVGRFMIQLEKDQSGWGGIKWDFSGHTAWYVKPQLAREVGQS